MHAGPLLDGASVFELLENEQCTTTAAVPTVWLGLLQHMQEHNLRLSSLTSCVIGGSAAPLSMIKAFQEGAVCLLVAFLGSQDFDPCVNWY